MYLALAKERFTKTPIEAMLGLSGVSIRLETNCQAAADQLRRVLTPCTENALDAPDFVLRVVAEPDEHLELGSTLGINRLSHNGLSFISLGYKSFIACDRQARQGIAFVSESLVTDEKRFSQHFLPALISLLKEFIEAPL